MTKSTSGLDFVTYAADNYAHWIEYWLVSTSRTNPDSRLWIYDVSASSSSILKQLAAHFPNAQVIPWPPACWQSPDWIDRLDFHSFWPGFNLRDELKYLSRCLRYRITGKKKHDWMIDKERFVVGKKWFLHLSCIKPYIIRDAMTRGNRPLAFVDADAVVLSHFEQFPAATADIAVTVVDTDQIRIGGKWEQPGPDGPLPVSVINAGVIFINSNPSAFHLIDAWIKEIARVHHPSGDQTALSNLLYRHNPYFYETKIPFPVSTDNGTVLVMALPCARFNQIRIPRDGRGISNDVAIAHFVGSWKQPEHWQEIGEIIRQTWSLRDLAEKEHI